MAKKEINIFGTSFLDLLSGALAAVIILFIIVPKMTSDQQNALDEIERLNVQVEDLEDMMVRLENSVPQDLFEEIQQQLQQIQQTIADLTSQVENLQSRLSESEAENERLRQEVSQLREQIEELERLREENRRLQQQQQQQQRQQDSRQGISDGKVFGIDAEVGVVCMWRENVDIDLHVKNLSTGEECFYGRRSTSFGTLNEDIQSRSADDDRFELFFQKRPVPGRYEISIVYYADKSDNHANVEGYAVMHPGKRNQIKIPYRDLHLSSNGRTPIVVGILTVTENSISLE